MGRDSYSDSSDCKDLYNLEDLLELESGDQRIVPVGEASAVRDPVAIVFQSQECQRAPKRPPSPIKRSPVANLIKLP